MRRPILPADLQVALKRLAVDFDREVMPASTTIDAALTEITRLPAASASTMAHEIRVAAGMNRRVGQRPFLVRLFAMRMTPAMLMAKDERLAWLFMFHGDGRVRQAALERLESPPASPFLLAALAWRLNDWAVEVRAVAKAAAERLLPATAPDVVASVALDLLDREFHWSRWTDDEVAPLNAAFARPDVVAALVGTFLRSPNGPLANRLRYGLRYPGYEPWLLALARDAVQPSVRATALKCLVTKQISWPTGFEWRWIDKTYGEGRWVMAFDSRAIEPAEPLDRLITQGLLDPSAVVRRVAADALIEHRSQMAGVDDLIARLAKDRSPSLRERADYMIRHPIAT